MLTGLIFGRHRKADIETLLFYECHICVLKLSSVNVPPMLNNIL